MPLQKKWELTGAVMDHLMHTKAVEREEAEKPKRPSLEEQERRCRATADAMPFGPIAPRAEFEAAADTLRALREEVVPFLVNLRDHDDCHGYDASSLLRKLGVKPERP